MHRVRMQCSMHTASSMHHDRFRSVAARCVCVVRVHLFIPSTMQVHLQIQATRDTPPCAAAGGRGRGRSHAGAGR